MSVFEEWCHSCLTSTPPLPKSSLPQPPRGIFNTGIIYGPGHRMSVTFLLNRPNHLATTWNDSSNVQTISQAVTSKTRGVKKKWANCGRTLFLILLLFLPLLDPIFALSFLYFSLYLVNNIQIWSRDVCLEGQTNTLPFDWIFVTLLYVSSSWVWNVQIKVH